MNLLSINSISKVMRDKILFENVSFGINAGEKIGLIGDNGTGKSTLFRILAGKELPDSGKVAANTQLALSYLEQIPHFNPGETVLDYILNDNSPVMNLIRDYEACLKKAEQAPTRELETELADLIEKMDKEQAWNMESSIKSMLVELGITDPLALMSSLSGGMFKKAALSQLLVKTSNLLLLDEPTNHLDIDTIGWLEDYLIKTNKAAVIITHDRYFLDKICDYILELDEQQLFRYDGNYSYYLEKKAEYLHSRSREQERLGSVLKTELEWLKRGPRARRGKSKERKERIINLMDKQEVYRETESEFSVSHRRLGKKILELKDISRAFNSKRVINPFSYTFKRGERLGLIGPNGSGKTTFLRLITGQLAPDTGTVEPGVNTHFGFFDQMSEALNDELTIIAYLKETAEYVKTGEGQAVDMANILERFSFSRNMLHTQIRYLSGGEKRRLYLVKILLTSPNFLVFDEPTNNFDIRTLSMLEDFLSGFTGCYTIVSHDRYFLDRTADFLFIFDGQGNISGFGGNYSDYMEYKKENAQEQKEALKDKPAVMVKKSKTESEKRKLSFKEQKEYENLMQDIERLEKTQAELEVFFASGETDGEKLKTAHLLYNTVKEELEVKFTRWTELAALAE